MIGWLGVAALFVVMGIKDNDFRYFIVTVIFIAFSVTTGIAGYNSWLEVCPKGIGGHWNQQKYFIPWRSIHAIWVEKENTPSTLLRLGTDVGMIILSLRGLPAHAILWNLRFRLPASTQSDQAQQLYIARRQIAQRLNPLQVDLPLEIRHSLRLKILIWCSTLFWALLIYLNLTFHPYLVGIIVGIFLLLISLFGEILLAESVKLDSEGINQTLLYGSYHISWDEIEHVRMGSTGQTIIVEGRGKRLVFSGLRHWHGPQAKLARKFFLYQIELRNITPDLDRWVELKIFVSNYNSRQA
jgi:hypothetical protein